MGQFVYPPELVATVKASWPAWLKTKPSDVLPPDDSLGLLLDVAYQVGLRKEEGRGLRFRIVCAEPGSFDSAHQFPAAICFSEPRTFSLAEVLRLAPASDPSRTMIGVSLHDGQLRIWGLLDVGAKRYRQLQGDLSGESADLPRHLQITVFEAGGVQVSYGDTVVVELAGGELQPPPGTNRNIGVFGQGPISAFFTNQQQRFLRLFAQTDLESSVDLGDVMQDFGVLIERLLLEISGKHHGGAILMIPRNLMRTPGQSWKNWTIQGFTDYFGRRRLSKVLKMKYACEDNRLWLTLQGNLAAKKQYLKVGGFAGPETDNVGEMKAACEAQARQSAAVHDVASFIAALSEVDGAVVLTDDLELRGFGAEILPSKEVEFVFTASDDLGSNLKKRRADERGTRHRSAYRFCAAMPEALAFVVSQDGDAKAIRTVRGRVTIWPHILSNRLSARPGFLGFVRALHGLT